MKLLLVGYSCTDPASRFRLMQYIPYLINSGYSVKYTFLKPSVYSRPLKRKTFAGKLFFWSTNYVNKILRRISLIYLIIVGVRSDKIWINRVVLPSPSLGIMERLFLYALKNKLIFDIDDGIHLVGGIKGLRKARHYLKNSFMIFAGNKNLYELALGYNSNVFLIPSVIDNKVYTDTSVTNQEVNADREVVRIGWIGSSSTQLNCLPVVEEALLRLNQSGLDFQLVIVSDLEPDMSWLSEISWTYIPWSKQTEMHSLNSFDIGIMPLQSNEYQSYKCGMKLIQYGAVGLVSVASPVGANVDIIKDGETGYLPISSDEWVSVLSMLIQSKSMRMKMGANARLEIFKNYSIESIYPKIMSLLNRKSN